MMPSTTTLVVVFANGMTAVVAAALLMLVLWQAPGRRMNQYFAGAMLLLVAYCISNGFARFIDDFRLHAAHTHYVAISFYGMFVVAVFYFASEFAQAITPTTRFMRYFGLLLVVVNTSALWADRVLVDLRPVPGSPGSYEGQWTTLGQGQAASVLVYLGVSAVVLYRMKENRGRGLWKAPSLAAAGIVYATVLWPLTNIPLQAVFLALAALALGLPVLRYELFNPLAEAHEQLARKHVELREASHLKSQFLATMSHELRTPLSSIIGYTELVLDGLYGALNDTQTDRLHKVLRNGKNLLKIINDVLDLNRIEMGQVTLDHRPLATPALLDSVLDTLEPLATRKKIALTRDFADAPPVVADEVRLRQIITNIAANAVKFTHEGGVTVRGRGIDDALQIEVIDTGIGIPADQFDHVFSEFHQVDNSTTREYEGTGLGLAITRKLVELHSGRIWLESTVGKGTTFFVRLPLTPPTPVEPPAAPAPPASEAAAA